MAWNRLNSLMNQFPYTTQCTVSLVLQIAGDAIAQVLVEKKNLRTYDYARSTKFGVFGFLNGLVVYKWYSFLDERIRLTKKFATVISKLAADQIIFAPLFILVATGLTGYLQEYKVSGMVKSVRRDFGDIMITELKVWPAIQFVNFYFIPLNYQLGFNSVFALAWNTYFCAKTYAPDKVPEEANPAATEAPSTP